MIIFDLDGTLADCEHRRHFVDPSKNSDYVWAPVPQKIISGHPGIHKYYRIETGKEWQPDWKAFYEACDQDKPIYATWFMFHRAAQCSEVEIWSGRCESVRKKTIHWLMNKCPLKPTYWDEESWNSVLKMRPVGDHTPDDILKEKWLNEKCSDLIEAEIQGVNPVKHGIQFVFDDRPKVIRMWRRRGIFVFNCCQHDEEF